MKVTAIDYETERHLADVIVVAADKPVTLPSGWTQISETDEKLSAYIMNPGPNEPHVKHSWSPGLNLIVYAFRGVEPVSVNSPGSFTTTAREDTPDGVVCVHGCDAWSISSDCEQHAEL